MSIPSSPLAAQLGLDFDPTPEQARVIEYTGSEPALVIAGAGSGKTETMAQRVIDQLTRQTVECLLAAALAEDGGDWAGDPEALARHPLMIAGLDGHRGVVRLEAGLNVPVIGLGASAPSYYGAVGARLGTRMILPDHAGVANAIGAVVG